MLGEWLFRRRTWLPLPLVAALLLIPGSRDPRHLFDAAGAGLVAAGEMLRLWAVRHIGVISRTRSDRLGPVIVSGPFAHVRNPLYLGNIAIWTGFSLSAHVAWMAPVMIAILGFMYHAVVRWEEGLLESRRGEEYRAYTSSVPRWIPAFGGAGVQAAAPFSWRDTFFSERGTLIAIAVGYALIWLKLAWLAA